MEPAHVTYRSLDGVTDAALTSPEFAARLLGSGRPQISVAFEGDAIRFTADTAELMLRARVTALLEDALGMDWRLHVQRADR